MQGPTEEIEISTMPMTADLAMFRLTAEQTSGIAGRRVLITGAGKDRGLGQALALAVGLGGAASVGVHFHRSYTDGFDLVDALRAEGVAAFPVQADVTNMGDLWGSRSYIIDQMGGPPDLVVCNSGLSEKGYAFGRALRDIDGEPMAVRRARVRQHFIDNLEESRLVLDTKIDGFLALTHLWAGEAVYSNQPARIVYISSRQALDPGGGVPGYVIANFAVLALPEVLRVNLGKAAGAASACSICYPFIRTGMTDEYADNPKVFGRWQSRMLEPYEAAQQFVELMARPVHDTDGGIFELHVNGEGNDVDMSWQRISLESHVKPL
jgi:NAD(P)-dependent dehydrogenase (short-subunit alcohol dehydrogenase family)